LLASLAPSSSVSLEAAASYWRHHPSLFQNAGHPTENTSLDWQLLTEPFPLTEALSKQLEQLGPVLEQFQAAVGALYAEALKNPELGWVASLYEQGKPAALQKEMRELAKASSKATPPKPPLVPPVIRPDVLLTSPDTFVICELDAVPGGIGFTGALAHGYRSLGFSVQSSREGLPQSFLRMLLDPLPRPLTSNERLAIVVSDESADYRPEMRWLLQHLKQEHLQRKGASCREFPLLLLEPHELREANNTLLHTPLHTPPHTQLEGLDTSSGQWHPVALVYRFFELFDLANVASWPWMETHLKQGRLIVTPTPTPIYEEKLSLALLQNPSLTPFWHKTLGDSTTRWLRERVPESWIVMNNPPHPSLEPSESDLRAQGTRIQTWQDLGQATQRERRLVLKPSGFSPEAWGSRGVRIGHDMAGSAWSDALEEALQGRETSEAKPEQGLFVLQRFHKTHSFPLAYYSPQAEPVIQQSQKARIRLCPYYFCSSQNETPQWAGTLVTACPENKKKIHGMREALWGVVASS
jgi:hypothetical protein